ncbi:class II glutamine amidotransferase, partial [bacterium]|nr:class II glutamine amidotransferase [bacterium]
GDGFGVGWFERDVSPEPAVFTDIRPAWNNRNLRSIAPRVRSKCIFAHVRAASTGDVTQDNCHPFIFKNMLFMHNGDIGGFRHIKRQLRRRLSDDVYHWIQGETDSEHFFALFFDNLYRSGAGETSESFSTVLQTTIGEIRQMVEEAEIEAPMLLNVAITNGEFMVATRYATGTRENPPTLYHSEGSRFECRDGVCHMLEADPSEHAVLIVSEKLTGEKQDWHEVPVNHFVVVREDLSVSIQGMRV